MTKNSLNERRKKINLFTTTTPTLSTLFITLVSRRGPTSTYAGRTHGSAQTCDILLRERHTYAPVTAGHTAYGQLKTNRQCVHGPNMGKIFKVRSTNRENMIREQTVHITVT